MKVKLNLLWKPRRGRRKRRGVCPPSKPRRGLRPRAFWPLCPRPHVLPRPDPIPLPTLRLAFVAPLLSFRSLRAKNLSPVGEVWATETCGGRAESGASSSTIPLFPLVLAIVEREDMYCVCSLFFTVAIAWQALRCSHGLSIMCFCLCVCSVTSWKF